MNKNDGSKISKLISYWLRHDPKDGNLIVDEYGWINSNDLINELHSRGYNFSLAEIKDLNHSFDKIRWKFNDDDTKVKATHGHSISVILDQSTDLIPPDLLYHGTSIDAIVNILTNGLSVMGRKFVHLAEKGEDAVNIGKRHGKPFLIEINAAQMFKDGITFYNTSDKIWLTRSIEPNYLTLQPWYTVDKVESSSLINELKSEVIQDHLTFNLLSSLSPLLRRYDCDDVLFIDVSTKKVYKIHLTFSPAKETNPYYPITYEYLSLEEWVSSELLEDQEDWYITN